MCCALLGSVPRKPEVPPMNISSMLYQDTAHFYWSFDIKSTSTQETAQNLYSPWKACNETDKMGATQSTPPTTVRVKNTGTTISINRCEKWPPLQAGGYFDILMDGVVKQYPTKTGSVDFFNPTATITLCSAIPDRIYDRDRSVSSQFGRYYGDLTRGLFDGNCVNQVPCPRGIPNPEDCFVLNLDPTLTEERKKDCIYIGNFDLNPEKFWQEKCLINPSKCEDNGFTVSMWVKYNYTWLATPNVTRFLVGTDYGDNPDPLNAYFNPGEHPIIGWNLWHYTTPDGEQNYIRVTVTDVNYLYIQDIIVTDTNGVIWPPFDDGANTFWTNIGFRWKHAKTTPTEKDYYIDIFLFGRQCKLPDKFAEDDPGCYLLQNTNSSIANATGTYPVFSTKTPSDFHNASAIYIGCLGDAYGSYSLDPQQPKRFHYTSAVVDDVAFWAWRLRDEEIPYLLGGKAMPKTNINPSRAKSVDIVPEALNPFYAMADVYYRMIPLDFTSSTPYMGNNTVQPLSTPDRMTNKNFPGRADPRTSFVGLSGDVLKVTYATQLLNSSSYIFVDPRPDVNNGGIVKDCPHSLSTCDPRGFALAIWVFIPATASLRVLNDHYTIMRNTYADSNETQKIRDNTWELYTEGNHVFIRLGPIGTVQFPGDCTFLLGRWTNLAFTYRADVGIQTYINGLPYQTPPLFHQLSSPTVTGSPAVTPNISDSRTPFKRSWDIIIGSDGYLASSLAGMAVNDLAIWRTYIYPFETYKFLGLSEREAAMLWNATQVWTSDYFIMRDRTLYYDKLGSMWLYPDIGIIGTNVKDSDAKGSTVMTLNTTDSFLGLRDPDSNSIFLNASTSCIANPGICDASGATFGSYFYIAEPIMHPGRHFLFTSGNVDDHCIGMAIWLQVDTSSVPNRVLWVEVSRYSDFNVNNGKTANYAVWRASVPGMDMKNATWYHFSIAWSMDVGLYFFINGVVKAWASRANIVGVDSITDAKPVWRYDNRVMMGINSFYDGSMRDTAFVAYETVGVYHKMFMPLDVPKAFGLIENPWYGTAMIWFDRIHLISNWQQNLYDIRSAIAVPRNSIKPIYGYAYNVTLTPVSARFSQPDSLAPIKLFNSTVWRNNFTVAIWVKINMNFSTTQHIFSTDKYLDDPTAGGFHIRVTPASGLEAIIGDDYSICAYKNWTRLLGKWINIAVSFNQVGNVITCWVNGSITIVPYGYPAPLVLPLGATNKVEANATFVVGGSSQFGASTNPQDFEIYQLAIYPIAMSDSAQLGLMMGMPQQEAIYLTTADYYWSFDGPAHDLFVPTGSLQLPAEAWYEVDRRIQGRALRSNTTAKSCVSLGNFAGTCLTEVSLCNTTGFVFSVWIKLVSLTVNGYIFSSGGQQPGEPGVYISLNAGVLGVGISNGTYLWSRLRIYINTADVWFNLMFRWNPTAGLEVYVNGQLQTDDVAIGQSAPIRNAQKMYLFTNATIGCSNSDMSKVIPVSVDDIWFRANYSLSPLTTDDCPSTAQYRNVFQPQMTESSSSVAPYNPFKKSWATPVFEIIYPADWKSSVVMDLDKQCPGDLSKCPNGFTVSFWFMLPSLKKFSRALLQLRSSQYQGIQIILDNEKLQQSLRVDMHNATHRWLVTVADYIDTNKWLQLTAAWDTRQLTVYTLNRQYAPVYAVYDKKSGAGNDWSATYSTGVTLDSNVWQYYIEDLNIWYRYLDNLKAYPMGISCVAMYTDYVPDDLPTPPVLPSSLSVAGICYLMSEDGKNCLCTKEQWDRGAVQGLSSADYFKILTMLQGKGLDAGSDDDLGIAKYQPAISIQDLLSVKKQIMNGAIMTLTDRTKYGLSKTAYDFVQLCSSVLYPIRSKETWEALGEQGDTAMGVADALEVFGGKVVANLVPVDVANDTSNLNNSIDIHSDNIIFTAEVWALPKVRTANFTNYTFPNYDRFKLQSATFTKKWLSSDTLDTIVVPASVLYQQFAKLTSQDKVSIVASLYDTMGQMVPPSLDPKSSMYRADVKASDIDMISRIISLKFDPPIDEKDANDIRVVLQHQTDVPKDKLSFCAFYTKDRTWNTTGCKVVNSSTHETICSCSHLTNFAVLMQPVPIKITPIDSLVLSILSYIGLIISMLSLMTLFYLFVSKTKLHNERNTIHINLVVALFLADVFFLFTGPAQYFRLFCRACAALMHYFYTATFMWLLMEGTYLFNAVVSGIIKGRLCCMIPLAWGVPLLVVAGVLAVDPDAYGGDDRCWLSFDKGFIFAFIGPILLIVILNAVLLGLVVYNMPNTVLRRDTKFYGKILRGIRHGAVLLPLFGVTWLFGLFAVNESLIVFQYLFVLFNSLQGLFIFLGFGWFQPDVKRYMCSRDDDQEDEDDPHKDVVDSESDLKTILSTMPPPTPELDRKPTGQVVEESEVVLPPDEALAASYDISETAAIEGLPPGVPPSAFPPGARQMSAAPSAVGARQMSVAPSAVGARQMSSRQKSAVASARARTSFMRPATSLMRPKSGAPSTFGAESTYGYEEEKPAEDENEAVKARELMDYLLDGRRVKDVPDFATGPK